MKKFFKKHKKVIVTTLLILYILFVFLLIAVLTYKRNTCTDCPDHIQHTAMTVNDNTPPTVNDKMLFSKVRDGHKLSDNFSPYLPVFVLSSTNDTAQLKLYTDHFDGILFVIDPKVGFTYLPKDTGAMLDFGTVSIGIVIFVQLNIDCDYFAYNYESDNNYTIEPIDLFTADNSIFDQLEILQNQIASLSLRIEDYKDLIKIYEGVIDDNTDRIYTLNEMVESLEATIVEKENEKLQLISNYERRIAEERVNAYNQGALETRNIFPSFFGSIGDFFKNVTTIEIWGMSVGGILSILVVITSIVFILRYFKG